MYNLELALIGMLNHHNIKMLVDPDKLMIPDLW